jgi:hypothetical protein
MARLLKRARRTAEAEEYFKKAQVLYERSIRNDPQNARLRGESAELAEVGDASTEIH